MRATDPEVSVPRHECGRSPGDGRREERVLDSCALSCGRRRRGGQRRVPWMQLQELVERGSQLRRERAWRRGQRNRLRSEERGAEHPETRYLAPEDAADVLHGTLDALRVLAFAKP